MTKEELMRQLVHYGGSYARAEQAEENINKHNFMLAMHKKYYISENEFAIYKKARRNMLMVPLVSMIIALIIGTVAALTMVQNESIDAKIALGLMIAITAWIFLFLIGSCFAMFTKSNKYLALYDKWFKEEWSRLEDLHAIFTPDGWKAYKNSRAVMQVIGILAFMAAIIIIAIKIANKY